MPPTEHDNPDDALGEKLEELESLLEKDDTNSSANKIQIPVLDELATEADFINNEDAYDLEKIDEQITDLAEKLEQKFSGELDQLVGLLKDNLKNSIVEELRNQANINPDSLDMEDSQNNNANGDLQGDSKEDS